MFSVHSDSFSLYTLEKENKNSVFKSYDILYMRFSAEKK